MGCKSSKDIEQTMDALSEIFSLLEKIRNAREDREALEAEKKINLLLLNKKKLSSVEKDALYYIMSKRQAEMQPLSEPELINK